MTFKISNKGFNQLEVYAASYSQLESIESLLTQLKFPQEHISHYTNKDGKPAMYIRAFGPPKAIRALQKELDKKKGMSYRLVETPTIGADNVRGTIIKSEKVNGVDMVLIRYPHKPLQWEKEKSLIYDATFNVYRVKEAAVMDGPSVPTDEPKLEDGPRAGQEPNRWDFV